MNRELVSHNRTIFDQLHPAVYKAAVGLVAWFALAAWILFDRQNDIGAAARHGQRVASGCGLASVVTVPRLATTSDGSEGSEHPVPRVEDWRFRGLGQQASQHGCGN